LCDVEKKPGDYGINILAFSVIFHALFFTYIDAFCHLISLSKAVSVSAVFTVSHPFYENEVVIPCTNSPVEVELKSPLNIIFFIYMEKLREFMHILIRSRIIIAMH
jgi:hypothetical protein